MERLNFYYQIFSWVDGSVGTLTAAFCCIVWTRPFLDRKEKAWLAGGVYAVIMTLLNFSPPFIGAMLCYIIGSLAVFFTICLLDRKYIAQKLFLAITFFCLRWQAPRLAVYIFNEIDGIVYRSFPAEDELFWFWWHVLSGFLGFDLLVLLFSYGAVRCILWSYGRKREYMSGKEFLLLTMPSLAGSVSYGVIRYYDNIYERDTGKSVYELRGSHDLIMSLFTILSFVVILVTTYVFRQWKTQQEEDRQREIFSTQMASLQSHINEVERLYSDLRSIRHDIGNHLMTLEQLYSKGEYEAAEQYAGTLRKEMQDISADICADIASGNPVTDVILSSRKKEMDEKGILFEYDFHYPMTDLVNSFDISIILNNALSNAIEALERESVDSDKTAHISLISSRRKNMYMIEVTNSCTADLEIDETTGLPRTIKSEEGHGFGLISIRHVAHKYLGDIAIGKEIYEGEERCILRVMLQITEKNELQ